VTGEYPPITAADLRRVQTHPAPPPTDDDLAEAARLDDHTEQTEPDWA
jgi:hypothetical protein